MNVVVVVRRREGTRRSRRSTCGRERQRQWQHQWQFCSSLKESPPGVAAAASTNNSTTTESNRRQHRTTIYTMFFLSSFQHIGKNWQGNSCDTTTTTNNDSVRLSVPRYCTPIINKRFFVRVWIILLYDDAHFDFTNFHSLFFCSDILPSSHESAEIPCTSYK